MSLPSGWNGCRVLFDIFEAECEVLPSAVLTFRNGRNKAHWQTTKCGHRIALPLRAGAATIRRIAPAALIGGERSACGNRTQPGARTLLRKKPLSCRGTGECG